VVASEKSHLGSLFETASDELRLNPPRFLLGSLLGHQGGKAVRKTSKALSVCGGIRENPSSVPVAVCWRPMSGGVAAGLLPFVGLEWGCFSRVLTA
jgi:hypothetical protein